MFWNFTKLVVFMFSRSLNPYLKSAFSGRIWICIQSYWIKYFEYCNSNIRLRLRDLENVNIKNFVKFQTFFWFVFRHIESAISHFEILIYSALCIRISKYEIALHIRHHHDNRKWRENKSEMDRKGRKWGLLIKGIFYRSAWQRGIRVNGRG